MSVLQTIDDHFRECGAPLVVPRLRQDTGGLDPLGLGQVNFALMEEALPGINNETTQVRPYSVMAWAWWKAAQLAAETGRAIDVELLRRYVDRADVIFVISQFVRNRNAALAGRRALGARLDYDEFDFGDSDWEKFLETRRTSTAVMAPVQYGPSIGALNGLGWLAVDAETGARVPIADVMPAILELDRLLRGHLPVALRSLERASISSAELRAIGARWALEEASAKEKVIFRARFYGVGPDVNSQRTKKRRATLDLIFAALRSSNNPATTEEIRKRMFVGPEGWNVRTEVSPEVQHAQQVWAVMQLRQLQRLAIESLLAFVERVLHETHGPLSSAAIAERALTLVADDLGIGHDASLEFTLAASNRGADLTAELFGLMEQINEAQKASRAEDMRPYERLPSLALSAFRLVYQAAGAMRERGFAEELFGGDVDRFPLRLFVKRINSLKRESLSAFWREVIEAWVLGQHVRWAVIRNRDDTQRLRVVLDEGGWVRMPRSNLSRFGVTRDRLHSALCLSASCDIIRQSLNGETVVWTAH